MQLMSALALQKPELLFPLCLQWQWRWNTGPQKAIWHLIEQSYYFSLPLDCDFHCFKAVVASRCKWLYYSRCEYVYLSNFVVIVCVRVWMWTCRSICVHPHHLSSPELPQILHTDWTQRWTTLSRKDSILSPHVEPCGPFTIHDQGQKSRPQTEKWFDFRIFLFSTFWWKHSAFEVRPCIIGLELKLQELLGGFLGLFVQAVVLQYSWVMLILLLE